MNGATALDCANTISKPNATKIITIGTSQNFFSCRRNWKNCDTTLLFFMMTSKHPLKMRAIAIARGIRYPTFELLSTTRQRILAGEAPDERQRHQEHREQQRQQNARVDIRQHARESPPPCARPLEQLRPDNAEEQQHGADSAKNLGAADAAPPPQGQRDDDEHAANRDAERPFGILWTLGHMNQCCPSCRAKRA